MVTPSTSLGSMSLVNWRRWKRAVDGARQGLGQRGLADAGDVFDQQVARASRQTSESRTTSGLPRMT